FFLQCLNEVRNLHRRPEFELGVAQLALARDQKRHAVVAADIRVQQEAQANAMTPLISILDPISDQASVRPAGLRAGPHLDRLCHLDLLGVVVPDRAAPLAPLPQPAVALQPAARPVLRGPPLAGLGAEWLLAEEQLPAIEPDAGVVGDAVLLEG